MRMFDSLVHVTSDGWWMGENRYDAGIERLLEEMERANVYRACLVGIAEYADNDTVQKYAGLYPDRFVPIAGFNPTASFKMNEIDEAVRELAKRRFAGIKLHPRLNRYDPLDPRCLAAVKAAAENGLVVFLDTLFRRPGYSTRHPVEIVDEIVNLCPIARIVLLHGCGASLLELFEIGRIHSQVLIDLSFTVMRYAGSSIDADLRFMCRNLDQRLTVGSDFPEYTPAETLERLAFIMDGLPEHKCENILSRNLCRLFADGQGL